MSKPETLAAPSHAAPLSGASYAYLLMASFAGHHQFVWSTENGPGTIYCT